MIFPTYYQDYPYPGLNLTPANVIICNYALLKVRWRMNECLTVPLEGACEGPRSLLVTVA